MAHPILAAHGLGHQLNNRWVWKDLTFELFTKECLGIVGPSGSGKTLLLRTLVLLSPLQHGDIFFGDRPINEIPIPAYRTQVIYLPQRPAVFNGTVEENLKRVFNLKAQRGSYSRLMIESHLLTLNRSLDFLNKSVRQLSGGESQILALLRALQLQPKVLLLDEPTSSLDPDTTHQVEVLLHQWLQNHQGAYLFTSHDPQQIQRMTHRQIHLSNHPHITPVYPITYREDA